MKADIYFWCAALIWAGVRIGLLFIVATIIGCTPTPKQIVRTEVVNVPVEIRARIPDEYLTDRGVAEPVPMCRLAGPPSIVVFCNNQVAALVDSYRTALHQSNLDKAAIRAMQPPETQP